MIKKVATLLGVIATLWGATFGVFSVSTYACDGFLGFVPWYDGVTTDDTCSEIKTPAGSDDGKELASFIWKIVANVAIDLSMAVGYLAVGFVIYGGFLFIMSDGDPGKVAKGKKTLTAAIIGVIIAALANLIIRTILVIFGAGDASNGNLPQNTLLNQGLLVENILGWAIALAGLVAAGFLIKAGFNYVTSQGDPAKAKKALQTIIYSAVGLVVAIAAEAIVYFVFNSIGSA